MASGETAFIELRGVTFGELQVDWVAERAQSTDQELSFTEAMRPV